jgi:single-strand DNA-binding protein
MAEQRKSYSFVDFRKVGEDQVPFGVVIANTTRDVDLRYTNKGKAVAKVGVALNNVSKHINYVLGTNFPENAETLFVELTAWERTAEMLANANIPKGSLVAVSGFLGIEEYEGKNGKQKRLTLTVSKFRVIYRKNDSGPVNNGASEGDGTGTEEVAGTGIESPPIDIADDDLPF